MKILTSIFLLFHFTPFAQPGPPIPFSSVIDPINKQLEEDPNNDKARLERIYLHLRGGNFSYEPSISKTNFAPKSSSKENHQSNEPIPIPDIRYLEQRCEDGHSKELLNLGLINALYGETYKEHQPALSKKHYVEAVKFEQQQRYYEGIFEACKKLNQIDSALLYHDTLTLLFHKGDVSQPRLDGFYYSRVQLLLRKHEYTQELVDYYNWLSTAHFEAYEEDCRNTEKGEYVSKHHLEHGLNFQYDLCDYYFKHQQFKQFELLVNHLGKFVPRNMHGVILNVYPYHQWSKLAGNLALFKGKKEEAIRHYLEAANHQSFHKDTAWSAQLLKANIDNPDAHVLHGLVSVNRSRQGYWFNTEIPDNVMRNFETAEKMGSNYYLIRMMKYFNLTVKKEFIEAEKLLNEIIASNPNIPKLYDEKYELYRKMYWSKYISEPELEKRLKIISEQVEKLRVPVKQPALSTLEF